MLSLSVNGSRIKLITIMFCISLLISLFAYSNYCSAQKEGGTLVVVRGNDSKFLDPAFTTITEDGDVNSNIFEGLVRFDNDGNILPCLATSWEMSDDGKTWTFHLRKDVKFHDGTPFNADAVVISLLRAQDEDSPYNYYPGRYSSLGIYLEGVIKTVEAVDSETVKLILNHPFNPLLTYLAMDVCAVVSPTALEKNKDQSFKYPVGTGPFVFKGWLKDDNITLIANENYWDGRPYLDEVIFKVVPDVSVAFLELQKGRNNVVLKTLMPQHLKLLEGNPNIKVIRRTAPNISYLSMNIEKKPLDNVLVRRAINHAIDWDTIIETILEGQVTRAINPIPPMFPEWNEEVVAYPFNPEKAKELLKEAGYPDGFTTELWTFAMERAYLPNAPLVAQKIQSDLKNVGINAKMVIMDSAIYWDLVYNLQHHLALKGTQPPPVADFTLRTNVITDTAGTGFHKTPEGQEVYKKAVLASQTLDKEESIRLYKEVQMDLHKHAAVIPICHADFIWGYNAKIQNLKIQVTSAIGTGPGLKEVWIEE